MTREHLLKRARFRAEHRGTKEADILIGGFFRAHAAALADDALPLLEAMLDEDDVDIMAWAIGKAELPERYRGELGKRLVRLDYIEVAR